MHNLKVRKNFMSQKIAKPSHPPIPFKKRYMPEYASPDANLLSRRQIAALFIVLFCALTSQLSCAVVM